MERTSNDDTVTVVNFDHGLITSNFCSSSQMRHEEMYQIENCSVQKAYVVCKFRQYGRPFIPSAMPAPIPLFLGGGHDKS